ncbi:hypothetical protein IQ249_01960 [Lusitaniella coriacea LEGE 07157]|uniref:Uncharacterized protein n=1 Tax=Lusitaniella coriacea LEGE 07157 TaxID=945747 RepID=A0A8J7DSS0_9CYAN|nr:hypothetical protein [Lusitaniella coriacea]MBE9114652.1 hypothetical protein [Lusitaniella coriacea LEGE 07157]
MPEPFPASRPPDCAIALQEEVATSEETSDACDRRETSETFRPLPVTVSPGH